MNVMSTHQKLDEIIARLDRMEKRQLSGLEKIAEVKEVAAPPAVGSFGNFESETKS